MEQKFINYLTTIILSILFPIARWAAIEMHSNHHGRPLNAHPGISSLNFGGKLCTPDCEAALISKALD